MQRLPASAHAPVSRAGRQTKLHQCFFRLKARSAITSGDYWTFNSCARVTLLHCSQAQEGTAGTVVEPPRASDLRSRGLCLVPISCTEHVAGGGHGHGNGADLWSVAARVENKGAAAGTLPGAGGHPGYLA